MDYPLENLGPDRFQALCQSLLAKLLPDIQCFPLYQSDGGRDALLPSDKDVGEHVVFQVKFVQDPTQVRKLLRALRQEIPKIKELVKAGAEKYYLLTNVRGTGKLGSGSIDTMRDLLKELPISAQCWWRDDICRRLDDAREVKFSFPEALLGTDVIRMMAEGADARGSHREPAVRAFLQDQYDRDKELRFNQIELQSEILDLFIDVPVELSVYADRAYAKESRRTSANDTVADVLTRVAAELPEKDIDNLERLSNGMLFLGPRRGAASFLLHTIAQNSELPFVIEGAPGQGKSTIAQYVCQIHRYKILGKDDDRIDSSHAKAPVRLPFRIECRDLAAWFGGDWPFADSGDTAGKEYPVRSVESFLAAQIAIGAGGSSFDVDDLISIYRATPILIFYDGLDEVADIKRRRRVVDEITRTTNRIGGNAESLQTIVTSRPAVFSNSLGLPEKTFPHLELAPIGIADIKEYAERWLRALKLSQREADDVHDVLERKLNQVHVRELARNPMQLSILLSLIRSHGPSLPEMRTALYDSYVQKAFDREAEKTTVVLDNRDLFIKIHRFVAWILHSEAETRHTRGSIKEDKLRELVQRYLTEMGYESLDVEKLFSGMVERIVALVSRVQGTFEF